RLCGGGWLLLNGNGGLLPRKKCCHAKGIRAMGIEQHRRAGILLTDDVRETRESECELSHMSIAPEEKGVLNCARAGGFGRHPVLGDGRPRGAGLQPKSKQ